MIQVINYLIIRGGKMFKKFEYKILYKRIFFTCLILVIYIIGSNISIVSNENLRTHKDSF